MANGEKKIRRTLQFKFTLAGAPAQVIPMIKSAASFYQMFGDAQVRLLQNVDDPSKFIQVVDYELPETMEMNRQAIASDPKFQVILQGWRALFPGGVEIDVFQEA
jgi:hypothetical protein